MYLNRLFHVDTILLVEPNTVSKTNKKIIIEPHTYFARVNIDLLAIQMRTEGLDSVLLRGIQKLLPVQDDITTSYNIDRTTTTPTYGNQKKIMMIIHK